MSATVTLHGSGLIPSVALETALAAIRGHDASDIDRAKASALMIGYDHCWRNAGWITHEVEQEFRLPIINPETGRASRTYSHGGKVDGIIEHVATGKKFLLEHKTTGDSIDDPSGTYWARLDIDAQVSAYVLSQWQGGRKLDGTLYDVIRKPGIRPKAIPKTAAVELSEGRYCGLPIESRQGPGDVENAELYQARLTADVLTNSSWYYQRKCVYRLDHQLAEYAGELWETADEIRRAKLEGRHYRNSGACMSYGKPCEFLGICSGHDRPDSDRWKKRESVHSELAGEGDGRDLLTFSRMACFRLCRRKAYYTYELGIERVKHEENEALNFGTLWHEAQAAWWGKYR